VDVHRPLVIVILAFDMLRQYTSRVQVFLGLSSSPPLLALGFVFCARPSLGQTSPSKERYQNNLGLNKVKQALFGHALSLLASRA